MPTFETLPRFTADLQHLTPAQRRRFRRVVLDAFVPDLLPGRRFRPGQLHLTPQAAARALLTAALSRPPSDLSHSPETQRSRPIEMIGRVQLPDSGSPLLAAAPHHYLDIATRVPWQYTGVAGEVTNCRSG